MAKTVMGRLVMPEVDAVLESASPPMRALAEALMQQVLRLHPEPCIVAWPKQRIISFGFGPKKMSEHYCYIGIQSKHINAGFYYGATLPDPESLLEGTGKYLRHVKVASAATLQQPSMTTLLTAAIAERRAVLE
ncbi:hypothetical protein C7S18_12540 [Ahniella affigens]|uniref:Uncharacterized protein n=1 Tax=Ahniella affigens TaxID=2021234 RepID=A0A2P1PT02_9GAMM|nr:DUF1801 domain-containing protein [Ahniella affigens]AVP97978.1 hypothetical protein C7S18_12540 [Ahniella affigens]